MPMNLLCSWLIQCFTILGTCLEGHPTCKVVHVPLWVPAGMGKGGHLPPPPRNL